MSERLQAEGQDLQLFRDETLGSGAYGVVCKAKLNELPCAAKLLHRVLFHPTIQRRFEQEHELLQNMKHPNVVQYLGVAHDPQSGLPILLMELLDGNLTDFLEQADGPIPYHLQVNLWYDIALALTYLHSKHIIHRDLSGNNVLLIAGSRAKVSDFGMSMLTEMDVTKSRLTHCPGNANYMSPEAMIEPPVYSEKLDVFSSGVVAVQIITQQFPDPTSSMMRRDDPKSPMGFSLTPVSEIERRRNHIALIDRNHPMLPVIQNCLRDRDRERPSARQLCHQLVSLKQASVYAQSKQQPTPKERRIHEQQQLIQKQRKEIEDQRRDKQQAIQQMQTEITEKQKQIQDQRRGKEQAVQQMQTEITKWKGSVQVLNTQLHEKSQELQLNKQELWKAEYNLQQKTEQLQQKTEELQEQSKDLQQALQGQEFQRGKENLIEQLPPAFVARFTAEELPHHIKKLIEEGLQEWEGNLCKFRLFFGHPSSGDLTERKLEVHKNMTLGEVTAKAYQALELEKYGVQLEQCQLVRYNEKNGTLGKPFDEPKEKPLGKMMDEPQSCSSFDLFLEIQIDPAALPQYEQEMKAKRVICINYSLIWQHLIAGNVLPKLMEKSVISVSKKQEVESYQQRYGQNAVIIEAVLDGGHAPEGLLTICDTLLTDLGKGHVAQRILRDYKRQPAVRALQRLASGSIADLSDISLQFQNLQENVAELLVQCPNALTQLKQYLASLVLPLGGGKVASLVDPGSYEAANTIPELFRLMAPYSNCLSTSLLSLLLEASGCKPAAAKLAKFEEARASSGPLVLCTQTASTSELRSVHRLPLEQLQSLHPAVFTESRAAAERNVARITAEVGQLLFHISCYEEVATAISSFFMLPKAALTFAGCSENPLVLCWLLSRDLLPYMRSHMGGTSGDRLLAEQQITQIVFGDAELYKCPNLKEVELHEAIQYGLLEKIPPLLTSVSVDTAISDGSTPLWIASFNGHQRIVELLLAAGAIPSIQNKNGWTPLHAATSTGHEHVVNLLLEAGASVEQETESGETPLTIARSRGYDHIVRRLHEASRQSEQKSKSLSSKSLRVASVSWEEEAISSQPREARHLTESQEEKMFHPKRTKMRSLGGLQHMTTKLKHKPRRFVESGFDLDLTYIKPNIIAMAYPGEKLEGLFRNSMGEVIRFFDNKHMDHYKVYNLCSEKSYDPGKFHQRMATYPFDDHNPPPFELIKPFCDDVDIYLKSDDRNVAVIHCTNGIGRTGVMICAYMLHDKLFDTAKAALQFYGEARTQNALRYKCYMAVVGVLDVDDTIEQKAVSLLSSWMGVTIPSQRRYVQYYGHLIRNSLLYTPKAMLLNAMRFEGIPQFAGGTCLPSFIVRLYHTHIFTSRVYNDVRKTDALAELLFPTPIPICGDINVEFFHNPRFGRKEKLFHFWFNTFFIDMHIMQQEAKYTEDLRQEREQKRAHDGGAARHTADHKRQDHESKRSHNARSGAHAASRGQAMSTAFTDVERNRKVPKAASAITSIIGMPSDYQVGPDIRVIIFPKDELDKANKDKKHYPSGFQVHVVLSEVESEPHVNCDDEVYLSDDAENEEEDLSDTDPEDDWNTSDLPFDKI